MTKFSLAGLLRLRSVQEDRAAADLGTAERERSQAEHRVRETTDRLAGTQLPSGVDGPTWLAAAASRLTLGALLEDDTEHLAQAEERADERRADWTRARQAERSVQRLEEHHAALDQAAELAAEQRALDEVAARAGAGDVPAGAQDEEER